MNVCPVVSVARIIARMRCPRFYCNRLDRGETTLDEHQSHHARNVLRVRAGDPVALFDGRGQVAKGRMVRTDANRVVVHTDDIAQVARSASVSLTLVTALPRRPRQSYLFEKCTELGVARMVLVTFEHSTVRATPAGMDRWRRTTIEAARQCNAAYLPELTTATSMDDAIALLGRAGSRYFGDPASDAPVRSFMGDGAPDDAVQVWIGPEGGFCPAERTVLTAEGVKPIRLCAHTLRIETACVAVAALLAARPPTGW